MLKKTISLLLSAALCLSLAACGGTASAAESTPLRSSVTETKAETYEADVTITFSQNGSRADGGGVDIDGSTVTITAEGTYLLTGTLADGQIVVDAKDAKVGLVFSSADITCAGSAALYVAEADKVTLFLAAGSDNYLTSTGDFQDPEGKIDAALFARDDVTIQGEGALTVSCETGHGIVSKDDLKIKGGTVTVTSAKKGLSGNDSVEISGGTVNVESGTDAIHAENSDDDTLGNILIEGGSVDLLSGSDGMDASGNITVTGGELTIAAADDAIHAEGTLSISGGSTLITRSCEGLEAKVIDISGGEIDLTATDDGINAVSGSASSGGWGGFGGGEFAAQTGVAVRISGGSVLVNAGGDGVDSNGDLTIIGGTVYISGPTNSGNGALDYNGTGSVTGGTLIAAGSAGMAQSLTAGGSQGVILYTLSSVQNGGTAITLKDSGGSILCSFTPAKSFQSVVISDPGIQSGGSYTLQIGESIETITMNGSSYSSGGFGGMGSWSGEAFGGMGGGPGGPNGGPGGPGGGQSGGFGGRS